LRRPWQINDPPDRVFFSNRRIENNQSGVASKVVQHPVRLYPQIENANTSEFKTLQVSGNRRPKRVVAG